ncbi:claudin-18-like protein, partial [Cricetulus griseus]
FFGPFLFDFYVWYEVPSEPICLLSYEFVWTLFSIMSVTACQGLGFVVSLIGFAGIIAATCMDQWSTQDLYNNPVTAVFNYQGLWRSCVRESSGFTECRGYFTLLGLPGKDQVSGL